MRRVVQAVIMLFAATSCSSETVAPSEYTEISSELVGDAVYSKFHTFQAEEAAGGESYATSSALISDLVAVGAPGEGAVYVYRRQNSKRLFFLAQRIEGDSNQLGFGSSVAWAADGTLFVGEPLANTGDTQSGRVLIYELEANRWSESGELHMMIPLYNARFGTTLAADGDRIAVGAPSHRDGVDGGSVHTYRYSLAGTWEHEDTITAPDREFGRALSLDDDRLAIGGLGRQGEGAALTLNGAAYVYEWTTPDGWLESAKIVGVGRFGASFGSDVAIEDDSLAVAVNDGNGHVYTFGRNAGGINVWGETGQIDGTVGSNFASSVTLDSGVLAVPSSETDRAIHLYGQLSEGSWEEIARIEGGTQPSGYNFATSVVKSGTTLIAAEPDPRNIENPDQPLLPGAIHVYDLNHAPEINDQDIVVVEDTQTEFTFAVSDADESDVLRVEYSEPTSGEIRGAYPRLRYRPEQDFFGKDEILATVTDEGGITRQARVTFEVLPVNDAPRIPERFEKAELTGVDFILSAVDPEGDRLVFEVVSPPSHGQLVGDLPRLHYKPERGYTGLDTFTYRAFDGELWSEVAEFDIFVPEETDLVINIPDENRLAEDESRPPKLDGCSTTTSKHSPLTLLLISIVLVGRWRRRKTHVEFHQRQYP